MNARVKTVTAAQDAVDKDGLIVVEVLKKQPMFDANGKFTGWIRWVIMDRANKDLPHPPEAASEQNEINEGISSGPDQTY
jgi:hypothetical protein